MAGLGGLAGWSRRSIGYPWELWCRLRVLWIDGCGSAKAVRAALFPVGDGPEWGCSNENKGDAGVR
jgi:hypothetical protein